MRQREQQTHGDPGALARRICAGERGEVERSLCLVLLPRIRAYGLLHLRSAEAADELVQDVLVVVLEALRKNSVEDPERLPAFVMGTCRHAVLHGRARELRRSELLAAWGPSLIEEAGTSAESTVDLERLGGCFGRLTPRLASLLTLTYFEESSSEEIGRELRMTAGAVRVARHRALKQLLACLEDPS